ncbi:uncharacterized protein EDB91DRAFT_1088156 [Suillus paluster]|uniref:uncharacterized protein n=1 Tax=Suillus paluster TaxID=48578 RepID=UPI001B884C89|nr:uncharacterized protein EDB91DRAFT_1088156 [Suillus paluster]KAG1722409.1 hypothetical protein EDB91DRAFT_1088156 [Suillus paluster]
MSPDPSTNSQRSDVQASSSGDVTYSTTLTLSSSGLNFAICLSKPPWSRRPAGPDLLPAPLVGAFDGGFSTLDTIASVGLGPDCSMVVVWFLQRQHWRELGFHSADVGDSEKNLHKDLRDSHPVCWWRTTHPSYRVNSIVEFSGCRELIGKIGGLQKRDVVP